MPKTPNLSISPEKVFFIINKSRQSESASATAETGFDAGDATDTAPGTRTDRSELFGFIRELNLDEQIDLVALTWLGRGDGDLGGWRELRAEARRAHNNRTASYLTGTPMLADYLEDAMSQFGKAFEDFEEHL